MCVAQSTAAKDFLGKSAENFVILSLSTLLIKFIHSIFACSILAARITLIGTRMTLITRIFADFLL